MVISWRSVVARRMRRHHLAGNPAASAAGAVRAMCGAHAQVLSAGEVSVALRLDGATRQTVPQDGGLVKTFGPRGTVHLLPLDDLPLWTGALSALPGGTAVPEYMRLTPEQRTEVIAAIGDAVADDDLTVDELTAEVVRRTGSWAGDLVMPAFQTYWPRWRQLIPDAANAGVLCYGPSRGRVTTYSNPHRLKAFEPMPGDRAFTELLHRYLYSYGPATPQQFARWLSTSPAFVKPYFADLPQAELAGQPVWHAPGDGEFPDEPVRGVRLLPYFDAYGVGSFPRELLFRGKAFTRALARGQAGNYPLLLVDGVVAGVWHHKTSGRKLHVTVEALTSLSRARLRLLDAEVDRLAAILGCTPSLTVGDVTVGPHA
ncbi:winged helix DNA-binding domain-containing protein [Kribbella turkmenica]|uniref:Winged helix DNA-binding domain-containing protein n=1 Tax=Kribbella turkmenica TaxID=2530375 RepID=A0A4V2YG82_9ACTN|nr:winged helix DNA-binding domain-containing protein [Kribbella turkmenica]TDD26067.1 winged helix DNA-binding domain-containing protein [Kribbella turkmenica]